VETSFEEFRKAFAGRLRQARGDLTQAQLAELTKYTQQMVSRYEGGRVPRAYWFLAGLSETGLDVGYLLTGRRRRRPGSARVEKKPERTEKKPAK